MYHNVIQFARQDWRFWQNLLPDLETYVRAQNEKLRPYPCNIPLHPENHHQANRLGTSRDYLSGLMLTGNIDDCLATRVRYCTTHIEIYGVEPRRVYDFYRTVIYELAPARLKRQVASWPQPRLLGMALLSLFHLEVYMRSGLSEYMPVFSKMPRRVTTASALKWLSQQTTDVLVDEWMELAEYLRLLLLELPPGEVIYNPVFSPLGVLQGSDADLVVGPVLYDLKTTVQPGLKSQYLRQLLCYVVMNRIRNVFPPVDTIGVIAPRQGFTWSDSIWNVCREAGGVNLSTVTREVSKRLEGDIYGGGDPERGVKDVEGVSWTKPTMRRSSRRGRNRWWMREISPIRENGLML